MVSSPFIAAVPFGGSETAIAYKVLLSGSLSFASTSVSTARSTSVTAESATAFGASLTGVTVI